MLVLKDRKGWLYGRIVDCAEREGGGHACERERERERERQRERERDRQTERVPGVWRKS